VGGIVGTIGALGLLLFFVRRRRAMDSKALGKLGWPLLGGDGGGGGGDGVTNSAAALTIDATSSASLPGAPAAPPLDCTVEVAKSRGEHEAPPAPGDLPSASASTGGGAHAATAVHAAVAASAFTPAQLSQVLGKDPRVLGAGAFGTVLVGTLPDGRPVAVKRMELASAAEQKKKDRQKSGGRANPYAGEAGFRLELEVLSKYVHPNLVQLIGHCIERKTWKKGATTCSIVLEFMPGGSLLARLRAASGAPALTAQERFDVAADVARALHYLHAEVAPPLIHQDVKSDNILLAEVGGRLVAKVADFGTARIAPQLAMHTSAVAPGGGGGQTHHSTDLIVGTRPYMAPEYTQMGRVSEKTDTFSFGVVLLELLTGMPPYDESSGEPLHTEAYDLLCDPPRRLAPLLDRRVRPASSWATPAAAGEDGAAAAIAGRALELCLVAKRCLEMYVKVRGTMREATPKVVALAAAR
jgi:hypothetical protein